jgi:hypothetical protein
MWKRRANKRVGRHSLIGVPFMGNRDLELLMSKQKKKKKKKAQLKKRII